MNEHNDLQPVTDRAQLVEWFAEKGKPKSAWRIGTEHEKFLFHTGTFKPVAYEGKQGVGQLLSLLQEQFDLQPVIEKGHIIGLKSSDGGSVTLEPGASWNYPGRRWSACMKLVQKQAHICARCARLPSN